MSLGKFNNIGHVIDLIQCPSIIIDDIQYLVKPGLNPFETPNQPLVLHTIIVLPLPRPETTLSFLNQRCTAQLCEAS